MGEIIPRPSPPTSLAFTGERLTSEYRGQTEIEHMHRYLLAREWCRDKDVLDVASGEGYGTALLAQVARSALGVEIAADAVAHATTAYASQGLSYVQGDAREIPAATASFDVVVSFETLEHFAEQEKFLAEVKRVLRPGGLFIVSTPDRDNYSPAETPANPYHVKELTPAEFERLLQTQFASTKLLLQRPVFGSVLMPSEGAAEAAICFERRGDNHFEGSTGLSRPQYLIAFASDATFPLLRPSVFIESSRLGLLNPSEAAAQLEAALRAVSAEQANSAARIAAVQTEVHQAHSRHAAEIEAMKALASNQERHHAAHLEAMEAEQTRLSRLIEDKRAEAEVQAAIARDAATELLQTKQEARGLLAANESTERAFATLRDVLKETMHAAAASRERLLEDTLQRHTHVEAQLAAQRQDASDAMATARQSRSDVEAMLASTSWKLTAPIRALGRILRRR